MKTSVEFGAGCTDAEREQNAPLVRERLHHWGRWQGPRVGDFLRISEDEYLRFTHKWEDGIQTTHKKFNGDQSFYMFKDGTASFSGSLDSAVPYASMQQTTEEKRGMFWMFKGDWPQAHSAINFYAPCRVFELI